MMQLALTFNDIFKSSFLEQVDSFAPLDMVIALALAFALGLFILYHKPRKTGKSLCHLPHCRQ